MVSLSNQSIAVLFIFLNCHFYRPFGILQQTFGLIHQSKILDNFLPNFDLFRFRRGGDRYVLHLIQSPMQNHETTNITICLLLMSDIRY